MSGWVGECAGGWVSKLVDECVGGWVHACVSQ